MKKFTYLKLTYIMHAIFVVSTIFTLLIVFKNIDNSWSFKYVIGYVIFILFSSSYFAIVTIVNMRTLKWFDIRKTKMF